MNRREQNWLVSVICIAENRNYIIASSPELREYLIKLLGLKPAGNWLTSEQLHLRKEIIGKMLT